MSSYYIIYYILYFPAMLNISNSAYDILMMRISVKKLTSCSSASKCSSPGIPLDVPTGPLLTNFSVVVTLERDGDTGLENDF